MTGALGRRIPTDFEHITKYPLRAVQRPRKPVPVVLGINWYESFDYPAKDENGLYWIGKRKDLGPLRGGHAVCVPTEHLKDSIGWYWFYNQGKEGACVGFAFSRMMTLLNRRRYDARWLWNEAKKIDEWGDTNPGDDNGTSVRAAMDVLRDQGHVRVIGARCYPCNTQEGILENRWATTVDELRGVLQSPLHDKLQAVPILNSWGKDYPHIVWMPYTTLQRLLNEYGEATLIVDEA